MRQNFATILAEATMEHRAFRHDLVFQLGLFIVFAFSCGTGCDGRMSIGADHAGEHPYQTPGEGDGTDREREGDDPNSDVAAGGAAALSFRILSEPEFRYTVLDVLEVEVPRDFGLPDDEPIGTHSHFTGNRGRSVGLDAMQRYDQVAEAIAASIDVDAIYGCTPETPEAEQACVEAFLADRGLRLLRRPLEEAEVQRYQDLFSQSRTERSWDEVSRLLVQVLLQTPSFLYHLENSVEEAADSQLQPLDEYSLAARLSYFLWRSAPDAELIRAAESGELNTAEGIRAEARRMLHDPKVARSLGAFHEQWLGVDKLDEVVGDKNRTLFPRWGDDAVWAVRESLARFATSVVRSGGTPETLFTSPKLPVNGLLAELYGLDFDSLGESFQPEEFPEASRDPRVISINFLGQDRRDNHGLAPDAEAGVVPASNWNNLGGSDGEVRGLLDQKGQNVPMRLTWTANGAGSVQDLEGDLAPNRALMNGYIRGNQTSLTLEIDGISEDVAQGGYDLYLYYDIQNGDKDQTRIHEFEIEGATVRGLYDQRDFDGEFVEGSREQAGNYVVFRNLHRSSIPLLMTVIEIPRYDCGTECNDDQEFLGETYSSAQQCRGACNSRNNFYASSYNQNPLTGLQIVAHQSPAEHQFRRTTFQDAELPDERAGLLTQPAFLAAHAHADSSSPIFRGVTIREAVMCQPPPPPPMNLEIPEIEPGLPKREQVIQMTSGDGCRDCHTVINPVGFGLENYDAIGRWRSEDGGLPVDASGEILRSPYAQFASPVLQDDTQDLDATYDGPHELATLLGGSETVRRCLALQWFRYALASLETADDSAAYESIYSQFAAADWELRELLIAIATSAPFRHRAAE